MKTILAVGLALMTLLLGLAGGLTAGAEHSTVVTETVKGGSAIAISTVTHVSTIGGAIVTLGGFTTTVTTTAAGAGAQTVTTTVTSLGAGAQLVNFNGSGNGNSAPFTASSSTMIVNTTIISTAPAQLLNDTIVAWNLFFTNGTIVPLTDQSSMNGEQGTFTAYGYGLVAGESYYLQVLAANADWSIVADAKQ
jgi:hypothetical protein